MSIFIRRRQNNETQQELGIMVVSFLVLSLLSTPIVGQASLLAETETASTAGLLPEDWSDVLGQLQEVSPLTWQQVKILTDNNASDNDQFGISIAMDGDTVVVGAPGTDGGMGSAFVFERNWYNNQDGWGEVQELTAGDPWLDEEFGYSVAISGDTIVVGARYDGELGNRAGAAYVFSRNKGSVGDGWGQVIKLTASDGEEYDNFGTSVSIDGDLVVVGAPSNEMAYVYERNQDGLDNWGELAKLTADDGTPSDRFGTAVAISFDTVVVGARGHNGNAGAAYVFERNEGGPDNWEQVEKLTADDGATNDFFGTSVAISGDTIVIGSASMMAAKT